MNRLATLLLISGFTLSAACAADIGPLDPEQSQETLSLGDSNGDGIPDCIDIDDDGTCDLDIDNLCDTPQLDTDGDGVVEEVPIETYGGARRVRLERNFYNEQSLNSSGKAYMPPPIWEISSEGSDDNPVRTTLRPDVDGDVGESDPCELDRRGLPYLD